MSELEIVTLGASRLDDETKSLLVQAMVEFGEGDTDLEPFGEVDSYQCLGVTSRPYPKDENGRAEGIVARGAGNTNGILVGGRDTRTQDVYGQLKEGETAVHSTGPNYESRTLYKDRQIAHIVGQGIVVMIDGKNKKIQMNLDGLMFEMSRENGISMSGGGKGGVQIKGDTVVIDGQLSLGRTPGPLEIMLGPPAGSPGAASAAPMFPCKSIKVSG